MGNSMERHPRLRSTPPRRPGILRRLAGWLFQTTRFFIATTVFFVLMLALGYLIVEQYIRGREIPAPNVVARPLTDAMEEARAAGVDLRLDRREPHESVPAGDVISQSPPPGARVKVGSPIRVVVSTGSPLITVPDLLGQSRVVAGVVLRNAGLEVGNIAEIPVPGISGGIVQATDPPPGAGVKPLPEHNRVNLLVSAGRVEAARTMPDVRGMSLADARVVLSGLGLRAPQERPSAAFGVVSGQVHEQEPPPGTRIDPSTPIVVYYAPAMVELQDDWRPQPVPTATPTPLFPDLDAAAR